MLLCPAAQLWLRILWLEARVPAWPGARPSRALTEGGRPRHFVPPPVSPHCSQGLATSTLPLSGQGGKKEGGSETTEPPTLLGGWGVRVGPGGPGEGRAPGQGRVGPQGAPQGPPPCSPRPPPLPFWPPPYNIVTGLADPAGVPKNSLKNGLK